MLKIPGKFIIFLNLMGIIVFLFSFFYLFKDPFDLLKLIGYFAIMLVIGLGFLNLFNIKFNTATMHLLSSLIVGICINICVSVVLLVLHIESIYSLYLLTPIGLLLILFRYSKTRAALCEVNIHNNPLVLVVILLMFFTLFVLSDTLYYTPKSVVTTSPGGETYTLSMVNSMESFLPVKDISYSGKEIKYHFGYPIFLFQIIKYFNIDKFGLIYLAAPILLISIIILFLYELSNSIQNKKFRILFIMIMLFSSIGIFTQVNPPFMFGMSTFGSYALSIQMLLLLFVLIRLQERNFLIECILLTGIALVKSPFFIPLAFAYAASWIIDLIKGARFNKIILRSLILLPGALYLIFFLSGAHKQTMWVIFPGVINILSTTLEHNYLLLNALISLVISLFATLGVGIFYLIHILKEKCRSKDWFSQGNSYNLLFFIILFSYLGGIFVSEIIEGAQMIFLYPGHFFLSILTLEFLFKRFKYKKTMAFLLVLIFIINALPMIGFNFFYETSKFVHEEKEPSANNLFANMKINMVVFAVEYLGMDSKVKMRLCSFPNDLLNGLQFLSEQEKGTFIFNKRYETCESYNTTMWNPSRTMGLIRTAIANQQTVVEGHQSRSILAQPDYCERVYENTLFYSIIAGEDANIGKNIDSMLSNEVPKFENLSYYSYFKHFGKTNYFTFHSDFLKCMEAKPSSINMSYNEKIDFLKTYITKNNITYLLFERGDLPLNGFVDDLGLVQIYSSDRVHIYKLDIR